MAVVVLCAGVVVAIAAAQFRPNSVVAVFCAADTIPAGTELKLRLTWSVKNADQATIFLDNQKLAWTVSDSAGNVLSQRVPDPEYGDMTGWSAPVYEERLVEGKRQKVYSMAYLEPTGVTLDVGETVTVAYSISASAKTDDGFGNRHPAFTTIVSGDSCTVTGAVPPPA